MRIAAAVISLSVTTSLAGLLPEACKRSVGATSDTAVAVPPVSDCPTPAPTCYTPGVDGCCEEPSATAVCGPRDAPKGTHLKWMCDGSLTLGSNCRGVGTACVPGAGAGGDATRSPHAVVPLIPFDADAAAAANGSASADAGKTAGNGTKKKNHH